MEPTISLRDAILGSDDLKTEEVVVPEWANVKVYVRTISGTERDAFEAASLVKKGKNREVNLTNLRSRLCILCTIDADGKQVFKPEDVGSLGAKSARALDRIYTVALRVNGFTEEDIEDLVGNSKSVPSGASGSN